MKEHYRIDIPESAVRKQTLAANPKANPSFIPFSGLLTFPLLKNYAKVRDSILDRLIVSGDDLVSACAE
jgi:hypothetical protein